MTAAPLSDRAEAPSKVAVPSTATIAMVVGTAVLGIVIGVVALVLTEADDEPQRILALVGIVTGVVAAVAAGAAVAQRRHLLSVLAVYGARDELQLASELLDRYPDDANRLVRARRLLEQTSDSYATLVAAGAIEEARSLRAARNDLERTLAGFEAAGK